jgi:hypothetical protein
LLEVSLLGLNLAAVYFSLEGILYCGLNNGKILYSTDSNFRHLADAF